MLDFTCDYNNGAHPEVLHRLCETNGCTASAYGSDEYSKSAADKIRAACGDPEANVFFLTGGTQTNMTVISSILKPYEGVVCAATGHINCHEAGAVEMTGHKIIPLPSHDGKIDAGELELYLESSATDPSRDHTVFPGLVYISYPTEYGTVYAKSELTALRDLCDSYGLMLFTDGARLGYGLVCGASDVTLCDIARLCDVFYIGGTKVGALCGEAVVFKRDKTPPHFITMIKQRGAMLAKSRLTGVQFDALFTNDLYFKISERAIKAADELKRLFVDRGYRLYVDSPTNQQFILFDEKTLGKLSGKVLFEVWERLRNGDTVVRFCTSWSTTEDDIKALGELL